MLVLFANKKRKKKAKQQRNNNSEGGGSGGFGNIDSEVRESAPAIENLKSAEETVAKLNALFSLEQDTDGQEPKSVNDADNEGPEINLGLTGECDEDEGATSSLTMDEIELNANDVGQIESSIGPAKDDEDETTMLITRYTEEFYRHELVQQQSRKKQLIQVSESPLIFSIDEFIDPESCRRVTNDASGCYDLLYPEQVADNLFNGQESELDGLLFNKASSVDHKKDEQYPDGLHMDTNNAVLNRHVTCILYLNDVPEECGGATVFPLARSLPNDPALEASRRLLEHQISHTRRQISTTQLQEDAKLLESRVNTDFPDNPQTSTAIKIQPKAGRLLVFFSRDSYGKEDPRAWHAGERLAPQQIKKYKIVKTDKRILTLFKEVDYENDTGANVTSPTLETYLAPMVSEQRQWLQAKAKLQCAILGQLTKTDCENDSE